MLQRNWVFATNSDFLITISLEPNVADLKYLKLWILLDKIIWFEISKVFQHRVLKILWFKYFILFQRLNSFAIFILRRKIKPEELRDHKVVPLIAHKPQIWLWGKFSVPFKSYLVIHCYLYLSYLSRPGTRGWRRKRKETAVAGGGWEYLAHSAGVRRGY